MIKIAHITGDIRKNKISGPKESITRLSKKIYEQGNIADIYSINEPSFFYNNIEIRSYNSLILENYDVIVLVGLYHVKFLPLLLRALWLGKKIIISPRSNLTKRSISSSFKKKAYLFLLGPIINRTYIHFLSNEECAQSYFSNRLGFISGNGVDESKIYLDLKDKSFSDKDEPFVIGYMGRLDIEHKGIDVLFDSLSLVKRSKINIIIYGPKHRNLSLKSYLNNIPKNIKVEYFEWPLNTVEEKKQFFEKIDFFIHTSKYEGVPQSVLESIANGVPVIVSKGTNIHSLISENELGFNFDSTPRELADVLDSISDIEEEEYNKMRLNCKLYGCNNLSWNKQADEFMQGVLSVV
tara:strand:- start:592 stop:1647 length:1056 start_codon:yes stop_codon:yes gene_type:complete